MSDAFQIDIRVAMSGRPLGGIGFSQNRYRKARNRDELVCFIGDVNFPKLGGLTNVQGARCADHKA